MRGSFLQGAFGARHNDQVHPFRCQSLSAGIAEPLAGCADQCATSRNAQIHPFLP